MASARRPRGIGTPTSPARPRSRRASAGGRAGPTAVLREGLALLIAWSGKGMAELSDADIAAFRAAIERSPVATRWSRRAYRSRLHSVRILLYELGILDTPPRRSLSAATLEARFAAVPTPEIRRAMLTYVEARSATLTRSTIESLANALIVFGEYLGAHHPEVGSLRALERAHVEGFLVWNRTRSWRGRLARPRSVSPSVVHRAVLALRNFLDDITLWGWAERPARRLVFAADVPRLPRPLPRALAPQNDAALMNAVDALADPLARCALTLLRRAGLRLGECLDLELECVVDYGRTGSWLRVPLGKLGTERMVPLEPSTLAALDAWAAGRGRQREQPHPRTARPTDFLFVEQGQRLGPGASARASPRRPGRWGSPARAAHRCASRRTSCGTPTRPSWPMPA